MLSAGEIVGRSFSLYRRFFPKLWAVSGGFAVPLGLLLFSALRLLNDKVYVTRDPLTRRFDDLHCVGPCGPTVRQLIFTGLLAILLLLLQTATLTRATMRAGTGLPVSIEDSVWFGARRAFHVLIVTIVYSAVVAAGFFALFVPGLVFAFRFFLAVPAMLVEGMGPLRALGRSWSLTKGESWHTLGALLLLWFVAGIPENLVARLASHLTIGSFTLLIIVAYAFASPLQQLGSSVLYLDLRCREGGAGVHAQLVEQLSR